MDLYKTNPANTSWAIIGSGIGGLASAIRLKAQGFCPIIFEKNAYPGGKLSEIKFSGFRFDAGPSLFTMPDWYEDLFILHGKNPRDYFQYISLKESSRYFYEDGTRIKGYTDNEKFAKEIAANTLDSEKSVFDFLKYSAKIYEITHPVFLEKSLHRWSTYLNSQIIPSILGLPFIDAGRSMNRANHRFFKDPKTIQIFNRYATYNGSNPFRAPATLNVIPHLENHFGAYFPVKGMISIIDSLVQLTKELEIPIFYNSPVDEILIEKNTVKGIRISDKIHWVKGVISNMDIYPTYKKLMPGIKSPEGILKRERSTSALIFYWGVNGHFQELDLHNIFFSSDYKQEFICLDQGKIYEDPTIYINISSKYKKEDAPSGMENWFTMINVPNNSGQDWDELIRKSRIQIMKKIERILGRNIENSIVEERVLDPREIEHLTSSYQGSLYGSSSNQAFSAFFRHPNFSQKISGLYFCGGSVHPGGGIPLALLSARITSEIIFSKKGKG